MTDVGNICNRIGRIALAEGLGVSRASVTNAIAADCFPASWRDVVEELCEPHGVKTDCPEFKRLFAMKPSKLHNGIAPACVGTA